MKGNAAKEDLLNFAASLTPLFAAACIVSCGGLADRFGRMRFAFIGTEVEKKMSRNYNIEREKKVTYSCFIDVLPRVSHR